MPELPEVETIARELDDRLRGRSAIGVVVNRRDIIHGDPRPLEVLLPGRQFMRVHRRAKRVIIELEPDGCLVVHLGMSGRLLVQGRQEPPLTHTHLQIRLSGQKKEELRFRDPRRFGGVWFLDRSKTAPRETEPVGRLLGSLGEEPLDMRVPAFRRILQRRRQIKALLLDQTAIAGLGNIYCDEALFAAGVHPATQANELNHAMADRLLRAIKTTLRRAIRSRGSTLLDYRTPDGEEGSFRQYHRVYQREGDPCHRCRRTIIRLVVAGRSTFVCPKCQPEQGTNLSRNR